MSQCLLPPEAQHILVWHQGALGDVLLAGPALQALAAQYRSHLTLVGGMEQLGLLQATLPVAAVWSGHQGKWLELFQDEGDIGRELKNLLAAFDLALIFTPEERPKFHHRLKQAGIPHVVWLPSFPVQDRVPIRELHAERLGKIGLKKALKPFRLIISESEQATARDRLQTQSREPACRVALAPGSGHPRKNWPLEYYIELARHLEELYRAEIWWLLGPAEAGRHREWQKKIPQPRRLQDLSLRHLAAVLAEFQLYVGNDSGVTHLAAALGRPTVAAIFGPSDPVIWAPPGERSIVITPEQPCAPCTSGRQIDCGDPVCLSTLVPEKVLAAISRFFSKNI
jgi:ADP-heptose:LPS heptosyltransferase